MRCCKTTVPSLDGDVILLILGDRKVARVAVAYGEGVEAM